MGRSSIIGTTNQSPGFDGRHAIFNGPGDARTVVVVSFSHSQNCTEDSNIGREGLFDRIVIDEAQMIRGCDVTKQGRILKSFKARFWCIYTGSSVVDTIRDIDGYLVCTNRLQHGHRSHRQAVKIRNLQGRTSTWS
jgi:hypothetical protein